MNEGNPNEAAPHINQNAEKTGTNALLALRSIWPDMLYLSMALIATPQIILEFQQGHRAWLLGTKLAALSSMSFMQIYNFSRDFTATYLAGAAIAAIPCIISYLAISALVSRHYFGLEHNTMASVKLAASRFLPRGLLEGAGILLTVLLFFQLALIPGPLGLLSQFLFLMLGTKLLAWPAILMAPNATNKRPIREALFARYGTGSFTHSTAAYFTLFTYLLGLFFFLTLANQLKSLIMQIDLEANIVNLDSLWPFGFLSAVAIVLSWLLKSLIIAGFAFLTTQFAIENINLHPKPTLSSSTFK